MIHICVIPFYVFPFTTFEKGESYSSFQQDLDTMLEFVKLYRVRYEYQDFVRLIDALKEEESDE